MGNRLTKVTGANTDTYTPAMTSNQLASITPSSGPVRNYTHDANGSVTADGNVTYSYDTRGRLIQTVAGAVTTDYKVNAVGQRIRKTDSVSDTVYHYDMAGRLIAETDASGTLQREYIYLGDTPVAVLDSSGTMSFIHTDHLNTPRLIANGSSQVVWRWDQLEPFGTDAANSNPSGLGVFEFNGRLTGQYFDKETNLHYNYFRDYDPAIGRYVQSDPIGLFGGINTYSYGEGNPLSKVDPTGEMSLLAPVVPAIVVGGIILMSPPGQKAAQSAAGSISKAIGAFCEPNDPCKQFERDLQAYLDVMDTKYANLLTDKQRLYTRAYSTPVKGLIGTWTGHVDAYNSLVIGLLRLIERGKVMGCPIPARAYVYLTRATPDKPAGLD